MSYLKAIFQLVEVASICSPNYCYHSKYGSQVIYVTIGIRAYQFRHNKKILDIVDTLRRQFILSNSDTKMV